MDRHLKALEFDRILDMLSQFSSCPDSRELALALRPSNDISSAGILLKQTAAAHSLLARLGAPSFGTLRNVDGRLSRAAAGGTLTMRDLLDICEDLRVIRSLSEWRFRQTAEAQTVLDVFFGSLVPQRQLEDHINTCIADEETMNDRASPALADIRRKKRTAEASIRTRLDSLIHSSSSQKYLQEPIITQRNGRYVVPVKNEYRANIQGLVHDTSGSGATVFIEPMAVVEANNEIRILEGKEAEEIERILASLSVEAGTFADVIKNNYDTVLELDLIFAKAQLAYKMKASVPELNADGEVCLKNARHPLLPEKTVVPTDISLGTDYDTLVITGPNTGGKTVSLKTLGLLTLMTEAGMMIPVSDGSRVCVFKNVFADIGDEQSIEQSLSTFSAHMVNIIDIMGRSGPDSLVLIDELGAGTDPVEGAALAIAILEKLHLEGAIVAATTHYAELKAYALQTPRVENACCEFDVTSLKPTYRLLTGVPGRSNAFAISLKLGMDADVVERAKDLVSTEDTRFEEVVDTLETRRTEIENEKSKAAQLTAEAEKMKAEAEQKLRNAADVLTKEQERARGEALKITENARREANSLLFEIDRLKKELRAAVADESASHAADVASRVRTEIRRGVSSLDDAVDPVVAAPDTDDYVLPRPVVEGDAVIVRELGESAVVTKAADRKGMVEIMAGSARMKVPEKALRLDEHASSRSGKPKTKRSVSELSFKSDRAAASADNRCDLRGMTSDEALFTLDGFVDDMRIAGIKEFTIIHGKGMGVLRSAVNKYLTGQKFVKSFRLGRYGEGEDGVTIVELK